MFEGLPAVGFGLGSLLTCKGKISSHTSGRKKFTLVSLLTKHSEVSGGSN